MNAEPEIILAGRDVEMRHLYWKQVNDRLGHLERYNGGVTRYEVEFDHEVNPRQSETSHRVGITGRGTGRTVHAEAWGADFRAALDCAVGKLEEQLRRRRDRRRLRHDRARRPAIDPARASNDQLPSDDTSRTAQPSSTRTPSGAAPASSGEPSA
jgi:ribosomal subunit interface protein